MEYVDEIIKTVNEEPMLQPSLHIASDKTEIIDNPTMEPNIASLVSDMDEQHEGAAIDRPTSIHIHDRLIDKTEQTQTDTNEKILSLCPTCDTCNNERILNMCQQCDTPLHPQDEHLEETLELFNLATTIEDSIYTQDYSPPKAIPSHAFRMLIDLGANRSATCHKNMLQDYKPIKKKAIAGPNKNEGDIIVEGIGYYPWYTPCHQKLLIRCYYSPDLNETIVSPTDVILTQNIKYQGFTIHTNVITGKGNIKFINIDGVCHAEYSIEMHNRLWYYIDNAQTQHDISTQSKNRTKAIINRLTKIAEHELWHQRLIHPGKTIMEDIHNHVKGVPKLKGNQFYKCVSCMLSKMSKNTKCNHQDFFDCDVIKLEIPHPNSSDPVKSTTDINATHSKDIKRGDEIHIDFGFMRGEFSEKDPNGRIITSVDGYNSYAIIVDRATRWIWILLTKSKHPPIEFTEKILKSFKPTTYQRRIRTDQGGELAKSQEFQEMIANHNYILEPTGAYTPEQNGMAERPNQTLGQMTRCLLHSSGLSDKYWSYAILHAVYVKNRLPHYSIKKTPYEAFHGRKPDLSHLRCFGSKVIIRNHKRSKKLHMKGREGYFMRYTGTDKNIIYLDSKTKQEKTEKFAMFDEAHYTSRPSTNIPPTAIALREAGYTQDVRKYSLSHDDEPIKVKMLSPHAKMPTQGSTNAAGWDIYSPVDLSIPPHTTQILPTHISIQCPNGTYGRIASRSSLVLKHGINTMAGVIDADYRGDIGVILHNANNKEYTIKKGDRVAQLIFEKINDTEIQEVNELSTTERQDKAFGSSDKISFMHDDTTPTKTFDHINSIISSYTPTMIEMSLDPYDNLLTHQIKLEGKHKTAGLDITTCPQRQLPLLQKCIKGTPSARIPKWRSTLKFSYIHSINDTPITSTQQIETIIRSLRKEKCKSVNITFATMKKTSVHPEKGIPQLYFDQLRCIAHHIHDIKHDEETINNMGTFTRRTLKLRSDWGDWNQSEYKQLDNYHEQGMFSEPVPLPPGANCLPLIWTYLIKLDGTKKSRCVCNGSKHQTGRVTIGETYAGNVDQYSSKVFWAGTAIHNYITIGADITNAFAEAPPPTAPLYVYVDDVYREWRRARGLSDIPKGYVLQVQKGIQGHPEAPRLWEKHIDKVLRNKGLVPSKHEPCLYSGTYNGEHVLFLRQVDDFAISSRYTKTCYDLIADINRDMKTKIKELGILTRFNGTDILQSRNFVKISNKTYIEKISKGKNINQQQAAFPLPIISDPKY